MSRTLSRRLGTLLDSHGRKHDYLRISLTEKCNLRCRFVYLLLKLVDLIAICLGIACQLRASNSLLLISCYLLKSSIDSGSFFTSLFALVTLICSSLLVKNAGVQKIRLTGG